MTRALLALLLTGCLAGGEEPLEGTWANLPTDLCHCTNVVTFGPLADSGAGTFAMDRHNGDIHEAHSGWYTPDGDVLHIVSDAGDYDLRWGMGDVPGRLMLAWEGRRLMWLFRVKPMVHVGAKGGP